MGLLIVLTVLLQTAAEAASPAFDRAVSLYKSKQYAQALTSFQSAAKSNPSDAMTHYYMALCYQSMNQMTQARQEYELVASGNNPQLRTYAASGLAQLGKYKPTFGGSSPRLPRPGALASASVGGARPSGRLKVLEFYADW